MADPIVSLMLMVFLVAGAAEGTEFTFELPDRRVQCFFEDIEKDTKCIVDFQVGRENNFTIMY